MCRIRKVTERTCLEEFSELPRIQLFPKSKVHHQDPTIGRGAIKQTKAPRCGGAITLSWLSIVTTTMLYSCTHRSVEDISTRFDSPSANYCFICLPTASLTSPASAAPPLGSASSPHLAWKKPETKEERSIWYCSWKFCNMNLRSTTVPSAHIDLKRMQVHKSLISSNNWLSSSHNPWSMARMALDK